MTDFHGPNAGYVLELYERYRDNPDALDPQTRDFFANWSPAVIENGAPAAATNGYATAQDIATTFSDMTKAIGAVSFAQSIRWYGHLGARLDPLGTPPPGDPELSPEYHGITYDDLKQLPASLIGDPVAATASNAYEAIMALQAVYSGSIGHDYGHVRTPEERAWLREAIESGQYRYQYQTDVSRNLLERLSKVETFELFLGRYLPKYRFSVEGLDMMVPMLNEMVSLAAQETALQTVAIAMAHRGRLNVLAHVMEKPYEKILAEFEDEVQEDKIGLQTGDVKYHMGYTHTITRSGRDLSVTMPFNPSHLEQVNPVTVGMARGAGSMTTDPGEPTFSPHSTMQILIHGDAAFPGQGVVAETFNLSRLPGYTTGGTIHIIANNQLGFTTLPRDGRSTLYASDLAKGFEVPVIHVNADDPAACIEAARIAYAYQDRFEKDILIDLIGYRRYGHNELDQPSFTQPELYQIINQHPRVRQIWSQTLIERGDITEDDADAIYKQYQQSIQTTYDNMPSIAELLRETIKYAPRKAAARVETAVPEDRLRTINESLNNIPNDFSFFNKRLEKTIRGRRDLFDDPTANVIDWAAAEELAFATTLAEGTPIRITGQDVQRGTFSHRLAVLHDAKTGETHVPLQTFDAGHASFEILNSPLSEAAALGFEYGYNIQRPDVLVLWEAQYGDFNNGAQTIIDEFIVSAREKWNQKPSLVMLLPHGYEGAGPDHSSARLERFLQQAARFNIRVANPTTAGQYFHLLRRQALLLESDPLPLIVMTPKSLLRQPQVASSADDLINGRWQPVIDDADADPDAVKRLLLCSGKVYYDLVGSDYREANPQVAVARVEQLYSFPAEQIEATINRYPNLTEVIWVQEEPKNMGAWDYMDWRLKRLVKRINRSNLRVDYAGRRRSSTPAEGSKSVHYTNQGMVIEAAFTHIYQED